MTIKREEITHKVINRSGYRLILPSYVPEGQRNIAVPSNIYAQSATQLYPIGTILEDEERRFRYSHVYNESGAAPRGRPLFDKDDPTEIGAYLGAQTVGNTSFTWTVQGATIAENAFAGGAVLLQGGFVRKIKYHAAYTIGQTATFYLEDGETIPETASASRYGILKKPKWANAISRGIATGQKAAHCVGVSTFDMTHNYYGWIQTRGLCGVIGTPATLGDSMAEQAMVPNQVGAEISVEAAHGYQVIGHCTLFDQIDWDNENFLLVDLCIE